MGLISFNQIYHKIKNRRKFQNINISTTRYNFLKLVYHTILEILYFILLKLTSETNTDIFIIQGLPKVWKPLNISKNTYLKKNGSYKSYRVLCGALHSNIIMTSNSVVKIM